MLTLVMAHRAYPTPLGRQQSLRPHTRVSYVHTTLRAPPPIVFIFFILCLLISPPPRPPSLWPSTSDTFFLFFFAVGVMAVALLRSPGDSDGDGRLLFLKIQAVEETALAVMWSRDT